MRGRFDGLGPRGLFWLSALTFLIAPQVARASCDSPSGLSSCIDTDTLWPHPGSSRFMAIGGAELIAPGDIGFGLLTTYLKNPMTLRAPTLSPSGLEVSVVHDLVDASFSSWIGLIEGLELGATLPIAFYQSGSGIAPYTSSRPAPQPTTFLRDPRLSLAYALLSRADSPSRDGLSLAARFDLAVPFGHKDAFASESGPVLAPSAAADFRAGRWFFGAELGLRGRASTKFANARMGSQAFVALGAGFDLLGESLGVAVEAFALPVLISQPTGRALVPAEWMAEARSLPFSSGDWQFSLGAGSALPLGESAITAPAFRAALGLRYAPGNARIE